jgi:biopolymer transport protein ExbB/TolQ
MNLLYLLVVCLAVAVIIAVILYIKAYKLNQEIKRLSALRHNDITETNKLFIEKSENELKLFFQFETVLEELVKLMRKADSQHTKIIEGQEDIRLILECTLKK